MNTFIRAGVVLLLWSALIPRGFTQTGATPRAACHSTCTGNLGENIFPNGDFGSGIPNVVPVDPMIAPGYSYQLNPPPNDGSYTIANSTVGWGWFAASSWIKIEDNGPEPNGYMMVVNASYQPGLFFEKKVSVCENTLYEMSIDVIAMNIPVFGSTVIQPNIAFEIDGAEVCSTDNIGIDATWHNYRFSFSTAPGVTEVNLSFRNKAPGGIGNDLAIDNISFRACGPEIDVPATAFFCAGKPLTLNAGLDHSPYSPAYYQWQYCAAGADTWQSVPTGTQLQLTVPQPQTGDKYRLVAASAPANLNQPNCSAVSMPVELTPGDITGFAIGGPDTILCNHTPAVLEAGAFAAYHWSTNAATPVLQAPVPGWYAVTVTSAYGCTATDSIYVYEAELTASATAADPACAGDENGWIKLDNWQGNGGPVQFSLNGAPAQDQSLFENLSAGTYEAVVLDSLGCRYGIPFDLVDPEPLSLSLGGDRDVLVCDSFVLSFDSNFPLSQYAWSPSGTLSCTTCPTPVAMPVSDVVYTLEGTDVRGCSAADSIRVRVLPRLDVYAPNVFFQDFSENGPNNYFTIFPSKSAVRVKRLEVYDRWGGLLFQAEDQLPGAKSLRWDGTDPRGRALNEGVFVWLAVVEFTDGSTHRYSGDVTLLQRGK